MKKIIKEQGYLNLFSNISSLIEQGRKVAVRYVNTALVVTYWLIGRRIVEYEQKGKERAEYCKALLKKLSLDLIRFGRGFTERNIEHMRQFYLTYPKISHTVCAKLEKPTREKSHTACAELTQINKKVPVNFETLIQKFHLSWSHYRLLMRIMETGTGKTYVYLKTMFKILKCSNNLNFLFLNPQKYAEKVVEVIKERKKEFEISGIKYVNLEESYDVSSLKEL